MKNKTSLKFLLLTCAALIAGNCTHAADREASAHGHGHGHDHGTHEQAVSGSTAAEAPNGGRLIRSVEPYAEFLLTEDRFVQITFLDHDGALVPVADQVVTLIGGDRSAPTRRSFVKTGAVLRSTEALPEYKDMPIVLQIKVSPDAKTMREKFYLNMSECSGCDFKEYACICGH
jgi:hypothetical protein